MVTEQVIVKSGHKQTEVGIIPIDWEVKQLGDVAKIKDGTHQTPTYIAHGIPFYSVENITNDNFSNTKFISEQDHKILTKTFKIEKGDILMTRIGSIGDCKLIDWDVNASFYVSLALLKIKENTSSDFIYQYSKSSSFKKEVEGRSLLWAVPKKINLGDISKINVYIPPTKEEQTVIAEFLSNTDELIQQLDYLIQKKKNIKQGAMQELLTGKRRLSGYDGNWKTSTMEEVSVVLDNLRIPLNESQRTRMKGDIPYCGANGIVDFVNDYVVDDDIILMAEDGGYFDEFQTRPIAYRMIGKCWVNNHAHIIKSKDHIDQNFLFHSLVHKNILNYISGGTRAKLNKSELYKIELQIPDNKHEQLAISQILSDMDTEIQELDRKRDKYIMIKNGMMQKLLTGEIRIK